LKARRIWWWKCCPLIPSNGIVTANLKAYSKYRILEYWIVDANNEVLEQYVLNGERYELVEVYAEDDPVRSEQMPCASFTMNEIIGSLPELPNF
jgi:Uma2 family endonuclease